MIRLAKDFHKNDARCSFWLNEVDDLRQFPDGRFGFIYTSITLQHIPKRYVRKYLLELIRVLQPGGIFVFQIPDRGPALQKVKFLLGLSRRLKHLFQGRGADAPKMEMNCLPEREVRELFSGQGVRVVDVRLTNSTDPSFKGNIQFVERGPVSGYVSKQYCVVKTA